MGIKDYKRLTTKIVRDGKYINTITSKGKVTIQDLIDRLAELEDSIENGILISKYFVVKDGNWYCACEIDTQNTYVLAQCKTEEQAQKVIKDKEIISAISEIYLRTD